MTEESNSEPVAARYDFDGHGYKYIDNGSGSDWRVRHPDSEMLYDEPPEIGLLLWIEEKTTLHHDVLIWYVVDGFEVRIQDDSGPTIAGPFHGATVYEALQKARKAFP